MFLGGSFLLIFYDCRHDDTFQLYLSVHLILIIIMELIHFNEKLFKDQMSVLSQNFQFSSLIFYNRLLLKADLDFYFFPLVITFLALESLTTSVSTGPTDLGTLPFLPGSTNSPWIPFPKVRHFLF